MSLNDLCQQAVKVARRLQALKDNAAYDIMLVKRGNEWLLFVKTPDGVKEEVIRQ